MAKLSARGRKEVFRLERQLLSESDSAFTENRLTIAVMDDRTILQKHSARWKDTGKLHTWGWKKKGKLKSDVSFDAAKEHYIKCGYRE